MTKSVRILLAEDHALVRNGFRNLLNALPDVEVVAEAANGRAAIAAAHEAQPSLVIMDIAMPELNGLQALVRLRRELPATKTLIVSMYCDEAYVRQAFELGAAGYLSKGASAVEFELAVRAISRGEKYIDSRVAQLFTNESTAPHREARESSVVPQELDPHKHLTLRQREVLQLVAEGYSTKEIATILGIEVKTAEVHRAHLMKRLGIHNTAGLARYAVRHGIVDRGR
jgi:DNA-binding NarL/FixJ family response regulator